MPKNIVLGVTGSIAAYKSLQLVTDLKRRGMEVVVIMTKSACRFIAPMSFKALSQNEVITDLFMETKVDVPMHVSLSNNADLVVVAPATANIIGKIASGIADDALTNALMASDSKKIIAPAMEARMYNNPILRDNIKKLESIGYEFLGPIVGRLASGAEGMGRMAEVDDIVDKIVATVEADPIDGVNV